MTNYGGYMGRIARLDLNTKKLSEYPWTDEDRRKYIGGKAVASKILFDNLKGTEDPLGEENILVISTGPVTGLGGPSSNRFDISGLSPLTGISASSNCGGNFGYYLKRAGYDALVITGKCDAPTWIEIYDDTVVFEDARELWGLKVSETQERLGKLLDAKHRRHVLCGMVTIGPAGENLVKYAGIISGDRAAGRTGLGAVMGSKNIKAIAVAGTRTVKAYDADKLKAHHIRWVNDLRKNPNTGGQMPKLGTASLVVPMQMNGQLGTKNFSRGTFEDYDMVSGETLAEQENIVNGGCLSCPIRCTRRVSVDGKNVKGPELETLGLLGPNILNNDLPLINRWNLELDELGMDTISTAQTVAWAMEANERGIWDSGLHFGETAGLSQLWDDIAHRRGIGAELAEGTKRLSEKYGGTEFALQSKGLELSAYEPRQAVGQGLGYAVSNRGGCHLNGGYLIALEGLVMRMDSHTTKAKADLCMFMQDAMEAISMNGQCLFTSYAMFPAFITGNPNGVLSRTVAGVMPHIGWAVRLLNKTPEIACFHLGMIPHTKELQYATGMKMTLGRFIRNGERSYNVERALNGRFGVSAVNDTLPKKLTDVPQNPDDPTTVVPLEKMKKVYYRARGWQENGLPDERKLKKLGIIE